MQKVFKNAYNFSGANKYDILVATGKKISEKFYVGENWCVKIEIWDWTGKCT